MIIIALGFVLGTVVLNFLLHYKFDYSQKMEDV